MKIKIFTVFLIIVFTFFAKTAFTEDASEGHEAPDELSEGSQTYLAEHDPPVSDQTEGDEETNEALLDEGDEEADADTESEQ